MVIGGDGDDGHILVNECQWAMLEFAGGIGLSVDVGDFLELQGAFQRDGVMHATAKEQGMVFVGELLGPVFDLGFEFQDGGDGRR